jgi:hypothetical protein
MGRFHANCNKKKKARAGHEKNPAKKGRVSEAVQAHREAGGTSKAEQSLSSLVRTKNREVYF